MRATSITIQKLFGRFDYTIPLNLDERITIIHGPNGYGKTALLRLVDAMFNQKLDVLQATPFEMLRVDFESGSFVAVRQTATGLEYTTDNGEPVRPPEPNAGMTLELFHTGAPEPWHRIEQALLALPVHLITIQRLLVPGTRQSKRFLSEGEGSTFESAVSVYSEEFRKSVLETQARYTKTAQHLDRSFPQRVMNRTTDGLGSDEELKQTLTSLEERRARLIALGLLPRDDSEFQAPAETFDEATRRLLWVYVRDVEEKLSVFDELAAKVGLLQTIIDKRFQFKQLKIDMEHGFTFVSEDDGRELQPTVLSSGEQHELILLYECLFKLKPDTLLLIDEPELSLHVSWQIEFLRDLQEIIKLAHLDVLIATHSPQIIHDRWDLSVDLHALLGKHDSRAGGAPPAGTEVTGSAG